MRLKLLCVGVIAVLTAASARAQFTQFAAPGALAESEESTKDRLKKAMEQARWSLGPLRLEPWVGVGNLAYYNDLEPWRPGKQSDYTVSAGAGLTAFLPLGHRALIVGYALPEYKWWRTYSNRDRLVGRYGVGAFADLGRLSLDVRGFRASQPWYIGYVDEVPIDVRREGADAGVELRLLRRLSVYGTFNETRWRYDDEDLADSSVPRLRTLDRDERRWGAGLRYRFQERLTVSLGYERSRNDFLLPEFDRSNSGSAPSLALDYRSGRLSVALKVAEYELEPRGGSAFTPFSGRTGQGRVRWDLGSRSGVSVYGRRGLSFAFGGLEYSNVETGGGALYFPLGWRASASFFSERSSNSFSGESGSKQDFSSLGVSAGFSVGRRGRLNGRWERVTYDASSLRPQVTFNRWTAGLDLGFGSATTW